MHGWAVYECPRVSRTGVPILRSMFIHTQLLNRTTPFYGYANSDILFDLNLVATLEALKNDSDRFKQLLVIGRRINYNLRYGQEIRDLASVSRYTIAATKFRTDALDYFISTHSGYPWDSIPDFVVGRVGYDNWLVATAIKRKISVVDASVTLPALHQTGLDGNFAGRMNKEVGDRDFNIKLAGYFDFSIGITTCSHFTTIWMHSRVGIVERPELQRTENNCFPIKRPNPVILRQHQLRRSARIQSRTPKHNQFKMIGKRATKRTDLLTLKTTHIHLLDKTTAEKTIGILERTHLFSSKPVNVKLVKP